MNTAIGLMLLGLAVAGCGGTEVSTESRVRVLWVYHSSTPVLLVPDGWEQVAAFDSTRECVAAARERVAYTAKAGRDGGAEVSTPELSGMYRVIITTESGRLIADSFSCWPVGVTPEGAAR